jgi:acyl carrier protein/GNAT superfamily N-acetyltransferase
MKVHEIHDLSNEKIVSLMINGLSKITDENLITNYHPDYSNHNSNLFYIIRYGRYRKGFGKYYIIEDDNKYVGSAGWNEYETDPSIAFALTRMYVDPEYRGQYYIAQNILSKTLNETKKYDKIWLTVNKYNKRLYDWFVRADQNKRTALFNDWPDVYRKFKPIGEKTIYNTLQYVVELTRNNMTDQEKLEFLSNAIINVFNKDLKTALTPEVVLLDIGLDSLDIVELQMHYEETCNVETSTDSKVSTVRDLMNLMK